MRLSDIKIESHAVPLTTPYQHADHRILSRDLGVISAMAGETRIVAELGPFPGINHENYHQAYSQLTTILGSQLELDEFENWDFQTSGFGQIAPHQGVYPSVLSAIEQLLFNLYYAYQSSSLVKPSFDFAGLVVFTSGWQKRFEEQRANRYRTFKVKLGRDDINLEKKNLRWLVENLPPDAKLRLDTNQSLGLELVSGFLQMIPPGVLDYIEEPDTSRCSDSDFPIAYDESLWTGPMVKIRRQDKIILKPQMIPFSKTIFWLRQKIAYPDQLVLSSCFDSSVALKSYLRFAHEYGLKNAHGFGTLSFLAHDLGLESLAPLGGHMEKLSL